MCSPKGAGGGGLSSYCSEDVLSWWEQERPVISCLMNGFCIVETRQCDLENNICQEAPRSWWKKVIWNVSADIYPCSPNQKPEINHVPTHTSIMMDPGAKCLYPWGKATYYFFPLLIPCAVYWCIKAYKGLCQCYQSVLWPWESIIFNKALSKSKILGNEIDCVVNESQLKPQHSLAQFL